MDPRKPGGWVPPLVVRLKALTGDLPGMQRDPQEVLKMVDPCGPLFGAGVRSSFECAS